MNINYNNVYSVMEYVNKFYNTILCTIHIYNRK